MMYRIFAVIIIFLLSGVSKKECSQKSSVSEPEPFFWAIIVGDMDRSIAWYQKSLDLELLYNNVDVERGFKQAALQRPGILLELLEIDRAVMPDKIMEQEGGPIAGFFRVGFRVNDFDKWHEKVKEAGVKFRGNIVNDPVSNKGMIILLDPDGNRIQLFEK